jgi:hypothetical protein
MSDPKLPIGHYINHPEWTFFLTLRYYSQIRIEAMPGYGKDSLAKTIMVLASKCCKLFVADYRGELLAHITQPNPESDEPACVSPYKAISNFTFPLDAFQDPEDWVSLGIDKDSVFKLVDILKRTSQAHRWEPEKVLVMLRDLPTSGRANPDGTNPVATFNRKYRCNLLVPAEWQEQRQWTNTLQSVIGWFWQGTNDPRQIVDFAKAWLQYEHVIVNFSDSSGRFDERIYRLFLGKMLKQLRTFGYKRYRGMIVLEEASAVIPHWPHGGLRPSSNKQVEDLLKLGRKDHIKLLIIFQNEKQIDKKIISAGAWQEITGRLSDDDMGLRYEPDANDGKGYREFDFRDIGGTGRHRFVPRLPVCLYETRH